MLDGVFAARMVCLPRARLVSAMPLHHVQRALTHLEGARERIEQCPIDAELRIHLAAAIDHIEDELCGAVGVNAERAKVQAVIGRQGAQMWAQRSLIIGGSGWSPLADIYGAYKVEARHPVSQKQFASVLSDAGVQRRIQVGPDGRRQRLWGMRLRTE